MLAALAVGFIILMVFASRDADKQWAAARPANISDAKWAERRDQCHEVDLAPAECAKATPADLERLASEKRAAEHAKLCARNDRSDAIREAEEAVKAQLKAPRTAKFVSGPSINHDGCKWTVSGEVDSQNSFGAMLRASYRVELMRSTRDLWIPTSVRVDE